MPPTSPPGLDPNILEMVKTDFAGFHTQHASAWNSFNTTLQIIIVIEALPWITAGTLLHELNSSTFAAMLGSRLLEAVLLFTGFFGAVGYMTLVYNRILIIFYARMLNGYRDTFKQAAGLQFIGTTSDSPPYRDSHGIMLLLTITLIGLNGTYVALSVFGWVQQFSFWLAILTCTIALVIYVALMLVWYYRATARPSVPGAVARPAGAHRIVSFSTSAVALIAIIFILSGAHVLEFLYTHRVSTTLKERLQTLTNQVSQVQENITAIQKRVGTIETEAQTSKDASVRVENPWVGRLHPNKGIRVAFDLYNPGLTEATDVKLEMTVDNNLRPWIWEKNVSANVKSGDAFSLGPLQTQHVEAWKQRAAVVSRVRVSVNYLNRASAKYGRSGFCRVYDRDTKTSETCP
jgi:hypothetical protein